MIHHYIIQWSSMYTSARPIWCVSIPLENRRVGGWFPPTMCDVGPIADPPRASSPLSRIPLPTPSSASGGGAV